MVTDISAIALNTGGDHDALLAADYPGVDKSVEAHVQEMVGTIGENMTVRRSKTLSVSDGVVASYMHSQVADGLGKIGVLVALSNRPTRKSSTRWGVNLPCMWRPPTRWR